MQTSFHTELAKTIAAHKNALAPYLAAAGLSPGQPKVLSYLVRFGRCKQRDLAEYYHIEPATVSRILQMMQKKGFVNRTEDETDKRAATVEITPKGQAAWQQVQAGFAQVEAVELTGFSEEETAAFRAFLSHMHKNLTGEDL